MLPDSVGRGLELWKFRRRGGPCESAASNVTFALGDIMALVAIKTASTTGYCDCVCGCYELASLRDEDTGKGFCPRCGKEHLEMNLGLGLPMPAPSKRESSTGTPSASPHVP